MDLCDLIGVRASADRVQVFLQLDVVESADWQARENLDATVQFAECSPESSPLFFL